MPTYARARNSKLCACPIRLRACDSKQHRPSPPHSHSPPAPPSNVYRDTLSLLPLSPSIQSHLKVDESRLTPPLSSSRILHFSPPSTPTPSLRSLACLLVCRTVDAEVQTSSRNESPFGLRPLLHEMAPALDFEKFKAWTDGRLKQLVIPQI